MNKYKALLFAAAVSISGTAGAHSASHTVVQIGSTWVNQETLPVMRETVTVQFDIAPADIGLGGQLVLAYQTDEGQLAVLTPSGWKGFVSGLAEPVVDVQQLASTYSLVFFDVVYTVQGGYATGAHPYSDDNSPRAKMTRRFFRGGPEYTTLPGALINARMPQYENGTLCEVLQRHGLGAGTVYAAYGALQQEAVERIEKFHAVKNPKITPEHLRNVYIELDGRQGEKYSPVMSVRCGEDGQSKW